MTSGFDDDNPTRSQPETAKKKQDREFYVKMIPYFLATGVCAYAFIFAPIQAAWVACGFLFSIGIHFAIKLHLEDKRKAAERQRLYRDTESMVHKRSRTAIPYPDDMVEAYMREGRGYWVRHYQHEGMGETQDDIRFAEDSRRVHLRGMCERKSCYFCHFHDQHAPYV